MSDPPAWIPVDENEEGAAEPTQTKKDAFMQHSGMHSYKPNPVPVLNLEMSMLGKTKKRRQSVFGTNSAIASFEGRRASNLSGSNRLEVKLDPMGTKLSSPRESTGSQS